ncbi:MAG: glycosyltransferase family 2 protein [Sphingomonadaceae bacterium]
MTAAGTARDRAKTVTVIIPAYNAEATLAACLEAIACSDRAPDEIIVFDDSSTDTTDAVATRFGARVINGSRGPRGPAFGRNAAARTAQSQTLVFVDADVVVAPEAIGRLERALIDGAASAAFGSYDDRPRSRRVAAFYYNLRHHWVHQRGRDEAFTFWSGLGAVDRDVFLLNGGFDPAYDKPSIEDVEFGIRIIEGGHRIRLVKDAQGSHCKDWTLRQLWHTDIVRRAIPWATLIRQGRGSADDLNISISERLTAVAAHLLWFFALAALVAPVFLLLSVTALMTYIWLNRNFHLFLLRKLPWTKAVGAIGLHWCYHLYASVTYAVVRLMPEPVRHASAARLPTRLRAEPTPPAPDTGP